MARMDERRERMLGMYSTHLTLFKTLKPKLFVDGNRWCCLYGDNIQAGIVGFGKSPAEAVAEFYVAFHTDIRDDTEG